MKKINIKTALLLAVISLSAASAFSQSSNSGYFTKGYLYRHELNPAFASQKGYFAMPGLGNLGITVHGDLGVENFIYKVNGKTTTFMNPGVSTAEFMKGIKTANTTTFDLRMPVLSVVFKTKRSYNTFGVNMKAMAGFNIPGSLFRLIKEGPANKSYDISQFNLKANAYGEVFYGHSREVNKNLRVGGKVKVLVGLADFEAKFREARLTLGQDEWTIVTDAEANLSLKGAKLIEDTEMRGPDGQQTAHTYVDDIDTDNVSGPSGMGVAFDLGAEYAFHDWTFSLAVLDLGFMKWKESLHAASGRNTFSTSKYLFNLDDKASNNFDDEIERLGEDLVSLMDLRDKGTISGRKEMLGATINAGAEYTLPTFCKFTLGLLSSTRLQKDYGWTEVRASANLDPCKWFSIGFNYAVGSYGQSFGSILSIHPTAFNVFVSTDYVPGKFSKQGAPLSSNANINLGINFPFIK